VTTARIARHGTVAKLTDTKNVMKTCNAKASKSVVLVPTGADGVRAEGVGRGNEVTVNENGWAASLFASQATATGSACVTWRLIQRAYDLSGSTLTENGDSKYLLLFNSLALMAS